MRKWAFAMSRRTKILWGIVAVSVFIVLSIVIATISAITNPPDFTQLRRSIVMPILLSNGSPSEHRVGPATPTWIPLNAISSNVVHAVISQEDASFFFHQGVDFYEIKEAIKHDLKEKKYARGASTITQQVVKNAFLDQRKTLWRKIKEFFWAREIERELSKNEILAFYLNMVEWGPGIYGIGQAAPYYFGVSPAEIGPKQAAFLAMLLPSPVKYHGRYFLKREITDWAAVRIARTLRVMHKMKFIDRQTYSQAVATSLFGEPVTPLPDDWIDNEQEPLNPPSDVAEPDTAPMETDVGSESDIAVDGSAPPQSNLDADEPQRQESPSDSVPAENDVDATASESPNTLLQDEPETSPNDSQP